MKLPAIPIRIAAAAVLLTLALIGIVLREGAARAEGQEIRLDITGYDPRELLSGHYVRFQIRHEMPTDVPCPAEGEMWMALRAADGRHVLSGSGRTRAQAAAKGIAVRGMASCVDTNPDIRRAVRILNSVNLDLGVNRIYVDQTQAEAIQKALQVRDAQRQPAYAVISVGKDGKGRLKGLVVAGRRVDLGWF